MTSTALTTIDQVVLARPVGRELTGTTWSLISLMAPSLYEARIIQGANSPGAAAWAMARAYELGFSMTAAGDVFHYINSKPSLRPIAALALIFKSGLLSQFDVTEEDKDGQPFACTVTMQRRDSGIGRSFRFTLDDARRAGLVQPKGAWEKWPRQMLYYRALDNVIDRLWMDVLMGLSLSTKFGDAPIADERTGELLEPPRSLDEVAVAAAQVVIDGGEG